MDCHRQYGKRQCGYKRWKLETIVLKVDRETVLELGFLFKGDGRTIVSV